MNYFSAAIFTGGPKRPELTARAIDSINNQTYDDIQKILVNNGRSTTEIQQIFELSIQPKRISEWTIISVQQNTYVPEDPRSVYNIPGQLLLGNLNSSFTWMQNDDDYIGIDFFERMHANSMLSEDIVMCSGIPYKRLHNSKEIIPPDPICFQGRPLIESGQKLFNKVIVFGDGNYDFNPGFASVIKTDLLRLAGIDFFCGGLMEYPSILQIASAGKVIFDREARIFLGSHPDQQRIDWTRQHILTGNLYRDMRKKMKHSYQGAKKAGSLSTLNRIGIRFFFNRQIAYMSYLSLAQIKQKESWILEDPISSRIKMRLLFLHARWGFSVPCSLIRIVFKDYFYPKLKGLTSNLRNH
jgi:hypothetical protein